MVKHLLSTLMFSLLSVNAMAAAVDRDNDGLIEINNLDDLNEMRNDIYGISMRGSSSGCPETGCFGYELTRDLDFDTNGNGVIDSGDWNGGQPWVPIGGSDGLRFQAILNGNFHSIRHLTINTNNNSYSGYGLIGEAIYAEIFNIGLLDSSLTLRINTTEPTAGVGTLIGYAESTQIHSVYAKNTGVISSGTKHSGILLGAMKYSEIKNSFATGSISGNQFVGGLLGYMETSKVSGSYAQGTVTGMVAGGLIGESQSSGIIYSYANTQVRATGLGPVGGLVGSLRVHYSPPDESYAVVDSSYALGSLTVSNNGLVYGGLIGTIVLGDTTQSIRHSYSKNIIRKGNTNYANLIGSLSDTNQIPAGLSIDSSFWVKNPEGILLGTGNSMLTSGDQLLTDMQCASNPINNNCAQPDLFNDWDNTLWDFGTNSQLPALKLKSNFPWFSTDRPNGEGDYESIARMKEYKPEYACDTPSVFAAKEIKSGYVFSTETPDQLKNFSVNKGLTCLNADQADGSCNNYETSVFCVATFNAGFWTAWVSNDRPDSSGDHETQFPSFCTAIKGIRARVIDQPTVYYGAPQKLLNFSLQKGLTCKNDDNADGCKNYEVRMTCDVLGDRE